MAFYIVNITNLFMPSLLDSVGLDFKMMGKIMYLTARPKFQE